MAAVVSLAVLGLSLGAAHAASAIGVVTTEGGKVSGVDTDVPGVEVFKGIPFAGPTGGDNRFKPPQPVEKWEGVKKADTWGDQALQDIHTNPTGAFWGDEFYFDPDFLPKASENGLNLNVWTPAKSTKAKLPVYVWIHGGANHHGYASEMEFYASKLAAKGIIVVSVQYRLGALGWLALPELSAESPNKVSGNYAMLDLTKALQWVHGNIAGFGGDPDNVTIGGQSAGARNSSMLLRSPLAKGLFHRAVIESGQTGFFSSPMQPLAEREAANKKAVEQVFGRPMSLADLRAIPTDDFISKKAADDKTQLYEALHKGVNGTAQHTVDGYVFTNESVDLLRPGALDGIDIMFGGTSDEYTSLMGGPDKTLSDAEFADAMSKIGYDDAWKKVYRPSDPQDAYRKSLRAKADYNLQGYLLSARLRSAETRTSTSTPSTSTTPLRGATPSSTAPSTPPTFGTSWIRSAKIQANGSGPTPTTAWRIRCRPISRISSRPAIRTARSCRNGRRPRTANLCGSTTATRCRPSTHPILKGTSSIVKPLCVFRSLDRKPNSSSEQARQECGSDGMSVLTAKC